MVQPALLRQEAPQELPIHLSMLSRQPPCRIDNQSIACDACQRTFRGQVCFNKRKTSKLCDKLKRCDRCMTYFWLQKNKQHVCGVSYCPTCRADKPVRHLCYMVPNNLESTKKLDRSKFLLCFYDLETRRENQISANMFRHESNLCISQQVCQACITNQEEICERCGVRENVFYGTDSVERFLSHLVRLSINFNVTVIAHNQGRFDGCFILQEMCKDFSRWTPEIVRNGTKLMLIRCGSSLRFIDRLNFIQLPLSQFPEAFNIAGCKGHFPHYFNTTGNENYVGDIPDVNFYGADLMKPREREAFLNWHREQRSAGYIFDMRYEMIKYCREDVNILRQSCLKFRDCFLKTNNVDPFLECITIASACNLVFRRNFLKRETIGIVPQNGYRLSDKQTTIASRGCSGKPTHTTSLSRTAV
jgi:hypothetical protein